MEERWGEDRDSATDALLRFNIDKSTDQAIRGNKSLIFLFHYLDLSDVINILNGRHGERLKVFWFLNCAESKQFNFQSLIFCWGNWMMLALQKPWRHDLQTTAHRDAPQLLTALTRAQWWTPLPSLCPPQLPKHAIISHKNYFFLTSTRLFASIFAA